MEKLNDHTGLMKRSFDEEEFYCLLDGVIINDTNFFNEKVREWENFYNYSRPHAALNSQIPYERFREKVGLCL
jgi:transposase InsO family protein